MKEDIADFVLNIKQLRVKLHGSEPRVIRIDAAGPREVKAGDITTDPHVEVLNKDLHLATLNGDGKLKVEMTVKPGRGFSVAERNKEEDQPLGVIVIDAFFTPIERVNYRVENARVGQATDYDRLVIEVWTNGGVGPEEALAHAGRILREHLAIFVGDEEEYVSEDRLRRGHRRGRAAEPGPQRQRARALGARRQLPQERRTADDPGPGAQERERDAQDQELRAQVTQRDQGGPRADGAAPRDEARGP